MIRPNHSIICFFTGMGQGAAAWMTACSEDTSNLVRTPSSSFNRRTNMVGTTCVWVTLWRSMADRNCSGSKCSMTTAVQPMLWAAIVKRNGAAWYIGAGVR